LNSLAPAPRHRTPSAMARDSPAREREWQAASAGEQDSRLGCDLSKHRRGHMALGARASDKISKVLDRGLMLADPLLDSLVDGPASAIAEEFDPELLEIAGQPGRQQPLPLIGGNEPRDLLLRPIEAERLAEARVGAGQFELIEMLAGGKSGDSENAVELIEANQQADDVIACAKREQPVAASDGLVADLGPDQPRRCSGDLAHSGLEQRAKLLDAGLSARGAQDIGDV